MDKIKSFFFSGPPIPKHAHVTVNTQNVKVDASGMYVCECDVVTAPHDVI